jgi:PKD repeat protein
MKTNKFKYMFALMLFSMAACKKQDPKPAVFSRATTPVFTFSGAIGGIPLSLQAGVNDYYISSSYTLNQNGVYLYNSVFKSKNCASNCPNSLSFSIADYRPSTAQVTTIDSAIRTGNYSFAVPSGLPSQFVQSFIGGLINKNGKSFSWNFGDQTPVVTTQTPSITHNYLHSGQYSVTLNVLDSTGQCSSSIANSIKLGQIENSVLASYYPSNLAGDSVLFTSVPTGGTPPYSYLWNFGDGITSTSVSPIYKYAAAGIYSTSLSIKDANGYTDVQHSFVAVQSSLVCASFFRQTTLTTIADPLNLSGIVIEWTDSNGSVWTSNNDKQTSENSSFKIVSVEDYINNENGDPTKKVQVEFSCKLYNGTSAIEITNAKATIAIAYKK